MVKQILLYLKKEGQGFLVIKPYVKTLIFDVFT